MNDVFLSYCSANEEIAQKVEAALTSYGFKVWKANEYTIQSGQDFQSTILSALKDSRVFLLLLTKESMNSKWVQLELTQALMNNKTIYPLRLDEEPIPDLISFKLGLSQYVNGVSNLTAAIENLHINIKKERDKALIAEKSKINESNTKVVIPYCFSWVSAALIIYLCSAVVLLLLVLKNANSFEEFIQSNKNLIDILLNVYTYGLVIISTTNIYEIVYVKIAKKTIESNNEYAPYKLYLHYKYLLRFKKAKKYYDKGLSLGNAEILKIEMKKHIKDTAYVNQLRQMLREKKVNPKHKALTITFYILTIIYCIVFAVIIFKF